MINIWHIYSGLFPLSLLLCRKRLEYPLFYATFPIWSDKPQSNQQTLVKFCFQISFPRTSRFSNIHFPSDCRQNFYYVLPLHHMDHHYARMSFLSVSSLFTLSMPHILVFVRNVYLSWCWLDIHLERRDHVVVADNSKISVAQHKTVCILFAHISVWAQVTLEQLTFMKGFITVCSVNLLALPSQHESFSKSLWQGMKRLDSSALAIKCYVSSMI